MPANLSAYPLWLVVLCLVVAGLGVVYVAVKLLKWTLQLLLILLLFGCVAAAVYWLMRNLP